MTKLAWLCVLLGSTLGCGGSDDAGNDAAVAVDASSTSDAADTADATAPAFVQIIRAGDFPTPNLVLTEFDDTELEAAGVTATGFSSGLSSLLGNADAPIEGDLLFVSGSASFVFGAPITAAGFSITDADFGDDSDVTMTLTAVDADDEEVGSVFVTVLPANSAEEENANAKFLGFQSGLPVSRINITRDQPDNAIVLDNLMYRVE